jgi:beta-1,4-mannosyltransferase
MKSFYLEKIKEFEWKRVKIVTPWLENEEYPLILAASDLGVCLHFSTSGLDLPMKVVDMFGCGLPVCAMNFKCITELVRDGENGFIFDNEDELTEQITNWFYKFPNNSEVASLQLEFSKNLKEFQLLRWKENWEQKALPLF